MKRYKIQSLASLEREMRAVARGERPAPADAAMPSFESVDAVVRLLTPENRALLAIIRDRRPQSVAELAQMSGRAQPNLTRTLAKLESAGFITMNPVGRRRAPTAAVERIVIEIDPYSDRDRLSVAQRRGLGPGCRRTAVGWRPWMLIVLAGLPGTGKTTLARELARRLGAVHLRVDSIEQALARSVLQIRPAEDAGYLAAHAVAEDNLRLGRTVIADSVNPIELTRAAWRGVAARAGCAAVEVEVVCSDAEEHRRRVEARVADIEGHRLPTWQDVCNREYEAWGQACIVVDTAGRAVERCVQDAVSRLEAGA